MSVSFVFSPGHVRRVRDIFRLERNGGKIVQRDDYTMIITDCCQVSDTQVRALKTEFPHMSFDVVSSEGSASGFCILLHAFKSHQIRQNEHLVAVTLQCVLYTFTLYCLGLKGRRGRGATLGCVLL